MLSLANGTLIVISMAPFHTTHYLLHCSLSQTKMLLLSALFSTVSFILLAALLFALYSTYRSSKRRLQERRRVLLGTLCYAILDATENAEEEEPVGESECPTRLTHSILVKVIPPAGKVNPSWEKLEQLLIVKDGEDRAGSGSELDRVGPQDEDNKKRKTKKRTRKKRTDTNGGREEEKEEEGLVLLYPFTTSSSGIQRKIKEQFDQLVKFHQSNCLTMTQVGQCTDCLLEAKKELQHRSEVIQRKFRITKALLMKADRSSLDRLHQQINRIELEQKRLQEDAFVYNRVQQHLRHSPAYIKMLKVCACPDMKAKTVKEVDSSDNDFADISFEELLAQEKKDVFWQKHRKSKA